VGNKAVLEAVKYSTLSEGKAHNNV